MGVPGGEGVYRTSTRETDRANLSETYGTPKV